MRKIFKRGIEVMNELHVHKVHGNGCQKVNAQQMQAIIIIIVNIFHSCRTCFDNGNK